MVIFRAPGADGLGCRPPKPLARLAPPTAMFNWLRRKRLSAEARRKLLLLSARAEEAIIETHANNLLDLLQALGEEVDLDRGIELYAEMVSLDESIASSVTNRVLTRLENLAERGGREARRYKHIFR